MIVQSLQMRLPSLDFHKKEKNIYIVQYEY